MVLNTVLNFEIIKRKIHAALMLKSVKPKELLLYPIYLFYEILADPNLCPVVYPSNQPKTQFESNLNILPYFWLLVGVLFRKFLN